MTTFKLTALATALLLQSLASAANAPANAAVRGVLESVSLKADHHTLARAEEGRDYFPLPDINDARAAECDPEDDWPRASSAEP